MNEEEGTCWAIVPLSFFQFICLESPLPMQKRECLKKKKNVTPAKLDTKFPGPRDQKMV